MFKFKVRLGNFSILTMLSFILMQVFVIHASTSTTSGSSDLLLFTRRDSHTSWPFHSVLLDIQTGEEQALGDSLCCATSWSPDGSRILVHRPDANVWRAATLLTVDANGGNQLVLTDPERINPDEGQWSPDSSLIYFWGFDVAEKANEARWAIYVVPARGGTVRRLTENFSQPVGDLAISPDGSQIVFSQNHRLYKMSAEGGDIQPLNTALEINSVVGWSSDGSQLAVVALADDGDFELYSIPANGRRSRMLLSNIGAFRSLSWSPTSREILFLAEPNGAEPSLLGVVNIDRLNIHSYPVGVGILEPLQALYSAAWSADGRQIVISGRHSDYDPYNNLFSLYLIDHDMTRMQRITNAASADWVVQWQPQD